MDDDKEDKPPIPQVMFKVINLEVFIADMYLTSYINFDVIMLPEIHTEKDPNKREKLKANFISEMYLQGIDPSDIDEMKRMYPIEKAEEVIKEFILVNDEGEYFVLASEIKKISESVSRNMIYVVFDELAKQGKVELCWNPKTENFEYGIIPVGALR